MLIYHYTTVDTFLKILESKAIWASDLSKMNDPQEFTIGIELVKNIYQEKFPEFLHWFESDRFVGLDNEQLLLGCSFSENPDDLSQWRAYGDDGKGVVIGINRSILSACNTLTIPSFYEEDERTASFVHFHKVIYSKQEFENSVKELLDNIGDFINDTVESYKLSIGLSRLACSFKSDFYKSEQEIRAIIEHSKRSEIYLDQSLKKHKLFDVQFRLSQFGLVPYCNVNLSNENANSIQTVKLGPKCIISKSDLEFMLLATGDQNMIVSTSAGQYR